MTDGTILCYNTTANICSLLRLNGGEDVERSYIAIDLKSFYASVECVERGLDPLGVNLVVADPDRTEKTICLAVSPSLKAYGVGSRPRLFEVVSEVKRINRDRLASAPFKRFAGSSYIDRELRADRALELDYIVAPPRMALYVKYSARIYGIYLKFIAPEDIHVYSIDEVFMDVTHYLKTYKMTARELAVRIIHEVFSETGITATAGVGTNMYLAKVAMDIVAKRMSSDKNGARVAELDEMSYRRLLWEHRPLTDFWRVGVGYARKLESCGMFTMGDIAAVSLVNEDVLYKLFGVNAELLIDHAWGWEPCTISEIKAYKPTSTGVSTGQVLQCPYEFSKARLIVMEMCDLLVLDLVDKGLATDHIVLHIGYDAENLSDPSTSHYKGDITFDHYGRAVPKHAHGTVDLKTYTSSTDKIMTAVVRLFDSIVDKDLLVRRINITACNTVREDGLKKRKTVEQLDMFSDYAEKKASRQQEEEAYLREKRKQIAIISIKKRFGKNAILKGMNFEEGGTTIARNSQIGGHRA